MKNMTVQELIEELERLPKGVRELAKVTIGHRTIKSIDCRHPAKVNIIIGRDW